MGYIFAITCALTWSLSVVAFKHSGDQVNPIAMNLFKNLFGFVLFVPTMLLVEGWQIPNLNQSDMWMLMISGVVGIGIADGMFLYGLKIIGATRTAIIDCLYSPFIIIISVIFLAESFSLLQALGSCLVVVSVFLINAYRTTVKPAESKVLIRGSVIAAVAILMMAVGVTMIKPALGRVPLFTAITLRLFAGSIVSYFFWRSMPRAKNDFMALFEKSIAKTVIGASFLATYVSMIFWVGGFKYAEASIAAVLNQTSTIFTVIFAAIILKEPMSRVKVLAAGLATSGVLLILSAQF